MGKIRTGSSWVVRVWLRNIFQKRERKIIVVKKGEKVWGFLGWLREGLGRRRVPELNGGMAPVPQFTRVFMDMNELCPGRESENKIIVSRMTYTDIWSLVRFMKLFANESSLSREHENLATEGKFPNCHFFVELCFRF